MSASVSGRTTGQVRVRAARAARRLPWLVDVYRAARSPRWEAELWRDLHRCRSQSAFLRRLPSVAPGADVALVALYRDDVYDAKIGFTLASALRLHGLRPVVSVPTGRARRVPRYATAFGVDDVIVQEHIALSEADRRERDDVVARLLDGELDFAAIKTWRFRGYQAGTHVLSTVIRLTFDGSPDLGVEENRELLTAVLRDVLTNYQRAEHLLTDLAPRVVLVEEANYSVNGPLVDVATAKGIDVIQTINTWRDDALMSKRVTAATRRVDAKSVAPETAEATLAAPWTAEDHDELDRDFERRYQEPEVRSIEEIVAELGLAPGRPTAVVFAHVLWDASLFYGVDLFENYADWLVHTVGAAVTNDRVNWIVKAHPSNVFRTARGDVSGECSEIELIREHFPTLPDHVKVMRPETTISPLTLYRVADYGVTVRGTPGLEMACFAKPVFTAGTGNYAGLGFTYDSETREEFGQRLRTIDEYGPLPDEMTTRARRYTHALFIRRPWEPRSFSMRFDYAPQGWSPLDRNVLWQVGSLDELRRNGDLDAWAAWVLDSRELDYLQSRAPRLVGTTRT